MDSLKPVSILVRNERGVLARIAGLFARRGFNITSLAVGETEDPRYSRITVAVAGDEAILEQVVKQVNRLVCVSQVEGVSHSNRVERGLAMIKVKANPQNRHEIASLARTYNARVDHVDHDCMIVELSASRKKVQSMIEMLRPYGIIEMARTGQIVLSTQSSMTRSGSQKTASPQGSANNSVYKLKTA
jgi:acetolactate synthase-1/3 small subunit